MPIKEKDTGDLTAWKNAVRKGKLYIYNDELIWEAKKRRDEIIRDGGVMDVDPFQYQYDLEVHLFLYYNEFNTGLPREEHFWRAASIRWPTKLGKNGRQLGSFCRNPWNERVIWAMCHYNLIKMLGGSGQGKTRTPLGAMLMIWDHFIDTPSGARMCFSSVDENKLTRAAWSNLIDLHRATQQNISKYAGRGIDRASKKITRPDMPGKTEAGYTKKFRNDGKGIIEGILVGGSETQAYKRIDKMTGAHVPTALCFLLDEYQSMPVSPMEACFNLSTHPQFFWVFQAGNPNNYDDPLGMESAPRGGWDAVTVDDAEWESVDKYGRTGIVLHFNNERSPGYEDPERYWYMPTHTKMERAYPTPVTRNSVQYYRMWKGWFPPDIMQNTVLNEKHLKVSGAWSNPQVDRGRRILSGASFDSAPASVDRSNVTIFHKAVERETGREILWFEKTIELPKTYAETYYRDTAKKLVEILREHGVPSGNVILDNTSAHGFGEELMRLGYHSRGVKYQSMPSEEEVDVNTEKIAKDECVNMIAEAALLTERFVTNGQIRGLNDDFCNIREELCARRWLPVNQRGKMQLEDKESYRDRIGNSPDIFDTILQACWFARHEWGMAPGAQEFQQVAPESDEEMFDSFNEIYDNALTSMY